MPEAGFDAAKIALAGMPLDGSARYSRCPAPPVTEPSLHSRVTLDQFASNRRSVGFQSADPDHVVRTRGVNAEGSEMLGVEGDDVEILRFRDAGDDRVRHVWVIPLSDGLCLQSATELGGRDVETDDLVAIGRHQTRQPALQARSLRRGPLVFEERNSFFQSHGS